MSLEKQEALRDLVAGVLPRCVVSLKAVDDPAVVDHCVVVEFGRDQLGWFMVDEFDGSAFGEVDQGWFHYVDLAASELLGRAMARHFNTNPVPDEDDYLDELGECFEEVTGRPVTS